MVVVQSFSLILWNTGVEACEFLYVDQTDCYMLMPKKMYYGGKPPIQKHSQAFYITP